MIFGLHMHDSYRLESQITYITIAKNHVTKLKGTALKVEGPFGFQLFYSMKKSLLNFRGLH